jgi:hypothetical protein
LNQHWNSVNDWYYNYYFFYCFSVFICPLLIVGFFGFRYFSFSVCVFKSEKHYYGKSDNSNDKNQNVWFHIFYSVLVKFGWNFLFSLVINFFLKIKKRIDPKAGKNKTTNRQTVLIIGFLNLDLVMSIIAENHNAIVIKISPIIRFLSIKVCQIL